ncbi:histidine acid phosphatase [Histomonas meleagridis]|uniref:histidine acid phosphatase n=1 Tax=Histomonas meleagridis TaxID=135588 RepID=UPI00355A315C|nr:histidine acid phosphatase [Histomonas meleagridis]KAH0798795.1 histidine acid phosphatase [Histomonas meleagridis]
MFFCIVCAALAEEYLCFAPTTQAQPVPDMELAYIQVITRHGMRSPIELYLNRTQRGNWTCNEPDLIAPRTSTSPSRHYRHVFHKIDERYVDYPPSCQTGDLTTEGMIEHLELGKAFRKYLVDTLKFLPEKLDPKILQFLSSPVDRCFRSAESFINGLYEPANSNEVLTIQTGSDSSSTLVIKGGPCKELTEALHEFESGEEMFSVVKDTYPYVKDALSALGIGECTYSNVKSLCSWTAAFSCSDNELPKYITQTVIDRCNDFNGYLQYQRYHRLKYGPGLAASYILRDAFRVADESLGTMNGKKFTLLSAHDTTISAVLVALGNLNKYMPPYASYLSMEIWRAKDQQLYVRYVFNGEPVVISAFNESLVRFDDFRHSIAKSIDYCHDFPK